MVWRNVGNTADLPNLLDEGLMNRARHDPDSFQNLRDFETGRLQVHRDVVNLPIAGQGFFAMILSCSPSWVTSRRAQVDGGPTRINGHHVRGIESPESV